MSTTQELQQFGYRFLGPVVTSFFDKIDSSLDVNADSKGLFFLAREGYFLQELYASYLNEKGNIEKQEGSYLLCSRAFLFKLALTDESMIPYTLKHHYKGSLRDFICRRYGFNGSDLNRIEEGLPYLVKALNSGVRLPSQTSKVTKIMTEIGGLLQSDLNNKRELYLNYLKKNGFNGDDLSVVDIGFSGTIQTLLALLTKQKVTGHYMVTTDKAINNEQCIYHGHLASGQVFGEGYPLIDRSLYLESILTAPHGQVIDIFEIDGDIRFGYAAKTMAQHHFGHLEQIVEGAKQYMADTLPESIQLTADEIPDYYAGLVSDPACFPEGVRSVLEVDDHISGFGILNPTRIFG